MVLFIFGILFGIIIGFSIIEFLVPRFPAFFNKMFNRMDANDKKIEYTYCRVFDMATRLMRNRGWFKSNFAKFNLTVPGLYKAGILGGRVLEIGPGPGYLGLEWLNMPGSSSLVGIELSREMVNIARQNAQEYAKQPEYICGDAHHLHFEDNTFDGAFSSASLHEWEDPIQVLSEMKRVLKPGAPFIIADLRRDASLRSKFIVWFAAWPNQIRRYFLTSFQRAYIIQEVEDMLNKAGLPAQVVKSWYTFTASGRKER